MTDKPAPPYCEGRRRASASVGDPVQEHKPIESKCVPDHCSLTSSGMWTLTSPSACAFLITSQGYCTLQRQLLSAPHQRGQGADGAVGNGSATHLHGSVVFRRDRDHLVRLYALPPEVNSRCDLGVLRNGTNDAR